jgi:hypothetical protein
MTSGIVAGLKKGASEVITAVQELGASAWDAFRSKLGIASPSKEFAKLGKAVPQGVKAGIESGTPDARKAAANIVPIPPMPETTKTPGNANAGGRGGRGAVTVNLGGLTINSSAQNAQEMVADIMRQLQQQLELVAIQLGAPTEAG